MQQVARIVKKVIGHPNLAPIRYQIWERNADRDSASTALFARSNQIRIANIFRSPILDSQQSKTLFILGSGWSINAISPEKFSHIASNQSIGVNFWFFHEFVPNAFSFDAGRVTDSEKDRGENSVAAMGRLFARPAILQARPSVLYLRPHQLNPRYLIPVPPSFHQRSWVSARANLVSEGQDALTSDLRLVLRRTAEKKLPSSVLPDNGSSVVRLIFLGLAQGFEDIVLVGVDLDSRPHFWFSPEYLERYPEYVALFPEPDGNPHGTTESLNRTAGNLEFLSYLNYAMTAERIGRLWVGSSDSRLNSVLPHYQWHD